MKKSFVFAMLFLLTACSVFGTRESYSDQLQSWIGRSEYQLYQSWGYPQQSFYVTPYEKIVTYIRTTTGNNANPYSNQLYYQGMEPDSGWWDKLFGPPAPKQADFYYCKTMFTVRNNMIVNFSFNGDGCTAVN